MEKKRIRFEFVLTRELKQRLKEKASNERLTPSEYLRNMIEK